MSAQMQESWPRQRSQWNGIGAEEQPFESHFELGETEGHNLEAAIARGGVQRILSWGAEDVFPHAPTGADFLG